MRYNISEEILRECEMRHFEFIRDFRLTGDLRYLKGFIADVLERVTEEPSDNEWLEMLWKNITNKEREALMLIIKTIGQEGNVSIVKLMQQPPNLSRPVFDNLLRKLDSCKIAEVTPQGVKGTKIKFLYPTEVILND